MSYSKTHALIEDGDKTGAEVTVNDLPGNRVMLHLLDTRGDEVSVELEADEARRVASMLMQAVEAGVR